MTPESAALQALCDQFKDEMGDNPTLADIEILRPLANRVVDELRDWDFIKDGY